MTNGVTRIKQSDGSWAPLKGLWRKAADGSWTAVKTAWTKTATGWRRIYPTPSGQMTFSTNHVVANSYTGKAVTGTVTITNTGEDSLTVMSYGCSSSSCNGLNLTVPITLAVGASATFEYSLVNAVAGTYSGVFDITFSTPIFGIETQSVPFTLTVLPTYATLQYPPGISISQRELDNTPPYTISISNAGNGGVLQIYSITSSEVTSNISGVPSTLADQGTTTFTVQHQNTHTVGNYAETITIKSNSSTGNVSISLLLTVTKTYGLIGTDKTSISTTYYRGDPLPSDSIVIYNFGDNTLNISSITSLNGTSITNKPTSIPANGSATITVVPAAGHSYNDTISIISDAGNFVNWGISLVYTVKTR